MASRMRVFNSFVISIPTRRAQRRPRHPACRRSAVACRYPASSTAARRMTGDGTGPRIGSSIEPVAGRSSTKSDTNHNAAKMSSAVTTYWPTPMTDQTALLGTRNAMASVVTVRSMASERRFSSAAGALGRGVTCARAETTGEDALALDTLLEPAAQLRDPGCAVTCASERDRHVVKGVEAEARAQIFTDTTGIPGRQEVRAVEHDDLARDARPPGAQVIRVRDVIAVLLRIDDPSHGIDAR